jgi:hypothetical protein
MTELSLPYVSVASAGDYFQVSFAEEKEDSGENEESEGAYFLLQTQFESNDGGQVYLESDQDDELCGHFRIRTAELSREMFRLELMGRPVKSVQIRFQADEKQYRRLKPILQAMIPRVLSVE